MVTDKQTWEKLLKAKEGVVGSMRKSADYEKEIKKISIAAKSDPLGLKSPPKRRLLTGTALDRILSKKGGLEAGRSVEIYGEFATGKTQIIESMVVESPGLIIVIDAEGTFSEERVVEICHARGKDPEELATRLLVYDARDWIEQEAVVRNLPEFDEKGKFFEVGLLVLDSLMKHWSSTPTFHGREMLPVRQQLIGSQLEYLGNYAKRHNAVFVMTNQVTMKPIDTRYAAPEDKINSKGGPTVTHFADYRIMLRKGPRGIRYGRLVDSIDLPLMEVPFVLDKSGIRDIKDPAERVKAMEIGDRYGLRFLSGQVGSKPAGKKYYTLALELGTITAEQAREYGVKEKDIEKALANLDASDPSFSPSSYELDEEEEEMVLEASMPEQQAEA